MYTNERISVLLCHSCTYSYDFLQIRTVSCCDPFILFIRDPNHHLIHLHAMDTSICTDVTQAYTTNTEQQPISYALRIEWPKQKQQQQQERRLVSYTCSPTLRPVPMVRTTPHFILSFTLTILYHYS